MNRTFCALGLGLAAALPATAAALPATAAAALTPPLPPPRCPVRALPPWSPRRRRAATATLPLPTPPVLPMLPPTVPFADYAEGCADDIIC